MTSPLKQIAYVTYKSLLHQKMHGQCDYLELREIWPLLQDQDRNPVYGNKIICISKIKNSSQDWNLQCIFINYSFEYKEIIFLMHGQDFRLVMHGIMEWQWLNIHVGLRTDSFNYAFKQKHLPYYCWVIHGQIATRFQHKYSVLSQERWFLHLFLATSTW